MAHGEYPYPADEFDAVDRSAGPRGSHRRPRSTWARLWPYVLVLALSAALAVALVGYVWDEREPAPSAQGSGPAGGATAGEAAAGAVDPGATASPSPQGEPDLAAPVSVVNATSVQGLAAEVAQRLRDAGWTEVSTGNYAGEDLATSTVRYGAPELEASARAVADELGITAVEAAGAGDAAAGDDAAGIDDDAAPATEDETEDDAGDDVAADDAAVEGIEVVLEADFRG